MKRTTVMIPDDLKIRAAKHAKMMGMSLGQFVRESLEKHLQSSNGGHSANDALFADDAVFEGKVPNDVAKNHDEYLYGDRS
jgi:predicted DNA-binding protein